MPFIMEIGQDAITNDFVLFSQQYHLTKLSLNGIVSRSIIDSCLIPSLKELHIGTQLTRSYNLSSLTNLCKLTFQGKHIYV